MITRPEICLARICIRVRPFACDFVRLIGASLDGLALTCWVDRGWALAVEAQACSSADDSAPRADSRLAGQNYLRCDRRRADLGAALALAAPVAAALGETFGAAWSGQAVEMGGRVAAASLAVSLDFAAAVVVAAPEYEPLWAVLAAGSPVAAESGARGIG